MSPCPDSRDEIRLRAAMVAAIRNAMEATCGYCPGDRELEEAVRAGLACLAEAGEASPGSEKRGVRSEE